MNCPKCGQEVGRYTRICPACGELLDSDSEAPQSVQPYNNQADSTGANYNTPPASNFPRIPDYKVQSILLIVFSSVFCCLSCLSIVALPFAIVALVTSNKIAPHLAAGNPDLAMEASKKTKMWCWISFGILIGSIVLSVVYTIYFVSSGMYQDLMEQFMDLQPQYFY